MHSSDAFPEHLRHLRIPLPLPTPADGHAEEDLTWAYAWPGGRRLCDVFHQYIDCTNLNVADLGCGRGLLGFTALTAGASRVIFADRSPVALAWIQSILHENNLADRAICVQHEWGDPLPHSPFHLIVGGDILYRSQYFERLMSSIASSLAPDGRALLADPRTHLEDELPTLAHTHAMSWTALRCEVGWGTLAELKQMR